MFGGEDRKVIKSVHKGCLVHSILPYTPLFSSLVLLIFHVYFVWILFVFLTKLEASTGQIWGSQVQKQIKDSSNLLQRGLKKE